MALPDRKHDKPLQQGPFARWNGGVRDIDDIQVIVIHDTESPPNSAQGVANYGATTDRKVSWHVVVDNNKAIRCVADNKIAWTAPPKNSDGLHVEICGYASYSKVQWFRNQSSLKRAAWVVARWCVKYDIPPVLLTDSALKGGRSGITTHAQVSRVYKQTDHTDPGKNFPMGYFMYLVRRRVDWLSGEV